MLIKKKKKKQSFEHNQVNSLLGYPENQTHYSKNLKTNTNIQLALI